MPALLKVVIACNVLSAFVLLLTFLAPPLWPVPDGHEMRLVPVGAAEARLLARAGASAGSAAVPAGATAGIAAAAPPAAPAFAADSAGHQGFDPAPARWAVQPDGSVRMLAP